MFINKEKHFFVEGKGKMSFLYNDFSNAVIDKEALKSITRSHSFRHGFELLTPPFNDVQVVTLHQIKEMSQNMKLKTAKRLGFRFSTKNNFHFFLELLLAEIQKYLYLQRFIKSNTHGPFV